MYQVKMMDIHILGSATLNTDIHNSPAAEHNPIYYCKTDGMREKNQLFFSQATF